MRALPSGALPKGLIALAAAIGAAAQGPPPAVIRSTTQLVEVNVIARNSGGPVAGLSKDDFVLLDRGREQKIAVFQANDARRPLDPAEHPGPNHFTNRIAATAPEAIIVLWDCANTRFEDRAQSRKQLLSALGQIHPQDRVGLYVLDSDLRVLQDFTRDAQALVAAARQYRDALIPYSLDSLSPLPPSHMPTLDALMAMENAHAVANSAARRAVTTAAAARTIAGHLAEVPGRKSVIWIAGEFPPAAGILIGAGITVYPVGAHGVKPTLVRDSAAERLIASRSGGVAFPDNDVRGAILQAIEDSQVTYTLGFYPDRRPGPMNQIVIRTSRPGIQLAYRPLYGGSPPNPATGSRPSPSARAALESPLDATQIGLDVRLEERPGVGWNIVAQFDPSAIAVENGAGVVDVLISQRGADGREFDLTATRATLRADYVRQKHTLEITILRPRPEVTELRLAVADRISGRIGSVRIPLPKL